MLVFKPVEREGRTALKSALQVEQKASKGLHEDLEGVEAEFYRSQAAQTSEIRDLKAQNELLKKSLGGQDLEKLQSELESCVKTIRDLTSRVGKAKAKLRLMSEPGPRERKTKRLWTAK